MQRWAWGFIFAIAFVGCTTAAPDASASSEIQAKSTATATVSTSAEVPPEPPKDAILSAAQVATTTPVTADAVTPAPDTATVPTPAAFITVTVGEGDTLLGLAMDHGVPMAAIQLQNDLGSATMVRLGQELVIPPTTAWEGASPFWIVHVVSEGETLSEIGKAYALTVDDLQGANGLADADLLSIGQPLVLPLTDFAVAQSLNEKAEALVTRAPEEPPAPTQQPAATVQPEDRASIDASATPSPPPPTVTVAPAPLPSEIADWGRETVRIMNEVRAAHGLPPLIYNETLARAAQIQADDCAARGSCSHTGSDGSTIKDRILRVGYQPATWAECWAIRPTPQAAIDIWMDEVPPNDPHRRTVLTTWLTEIGVGVAKAHWGYYFIADFGKHRQ